MTILGETKLDESVRRGVIAIGNFDGVHRGHQAMIGVLRREADRRETHAVAVTFDPPPVEILRPGQAPPRLTTLGDKQALLKAAGADLVLVIPTTRELLSLSATDFFQQVLQTELEIRGLVEGPNFRFGRGREGDIVLLRRLADDAGLSLAIVEPVEHDAGLVSSSRIRDLVARGSLVEASLMLGRPHRVRGTVERGAGRGAGLGFPTANLAGIEVLLPPEGVYAGRVPIGDEIFAAAIHLGPNRTFGEANSKLEVHVMDFAGDLYGQSLCVELIDQVRPTMTFAGSEALVSQMHADCARVRELLAVWERGGGEEGETGRQSE